MTSSNFVHVGRTDSSAFVVTSDTFPRNWLYWDYEKLSSISRITSCRRSGYNNVPRCVSDRHLIFVKLPDVPFDWVMRTGGALIETFKSRDNPIPFWRQFNQTHVEPICSLYRRFFCHSPQHCRANLMTSSSCVHGGGTDFISRHIY